MKSAKFALAGFFLCAPAISHGTDTPLHEQLLARAESGETGEVLAEIDTRLEHGEDRELRFLRARLLAETGREQQAIEAYRQLIERYPDLPEPYNNLAALLAQRGELKQAQQLLEQGIRTHPAYAAVYENLSVVFIELARDSYGKALRIKHQQDTVAMQQLARLHTPQATTKRASAPRADTDPRPGQAPAARTPSLASATPSRFAAPDVEAREQQIVRTLQQWAASWSEQAIEPYLDAYASDYAPVDMSRRAWQQQRRRRLATPAWIEVELSDVQVTRVQEDTATVKLTQRYRSNTYQDLTRKRFELRRDADGWRIVEETTLEQLSP